jgi:hypothetical protein
MRDQYVADVGDFGKYALLKALAAVTCGWECSGGHHHRDIVSEVQAINVTVGQWQLAVAKG